MRESLRSLLRFLVIASAIGLAMVWWQRRPPSSYGAHWNHLFKPPGDIEAAVPAFLYGAFDVYDEPPAIAYFVRIDDPQDLRSPIPWLEDDDGRIYVEGRRILPRDGVVQMFVADGPNDPRLVILSGADREEFYEFLNSPTGYEDCALFWNAVLRTNHLPGLSKEEIPPPT